MSEKTWTFNFKEEDETLNADIKISFSDCEDDSNEFAERVKEFHCNNCDSKFYSYLQLQRHKKK